VPTGVQQYHLVPTMTFSGAPAAMEAIIRDGNAIMFISYLK